MSRASSAGHEEGEAWLPFVVDCVVCETTHALTGGDRRACPFEGSQRASLAPGRRQLVPLSEGKTGTTDRPTAPFLR